MAEAWVERRLAAILAADVAGYSRLMGIDEHGTHAALKACQSQLIYPKVADTAAVSSRQQEMAFFQNFQVS